MIDADHPNKESEGIKGVLLGVSDSDVKVIFLADNVVLAKYITGKKDVVGTGNILAVKISLIGFHALFIIN